MESSTLFMPKPIQIEWENDHITLLYQPMNDKSQSIVGVNDGLRNDQATYRLPHCMSDYCFKSG